MTMSDWIVFVRVLSPYLLYNCGVHDDVLKLWSPLRQAAVYFLDYKEGQHHTALIRKAQDMLAAYAHHAERMVPHRILNTIQLHNCVFHLPTAVLHWGPSIFRTEFWVERMMQLLKRITKYRTMCCPEMVAAGAWLLKRRLAAGAAMYPELMEIWDKIDPMTTRFAAPDSFDVDGNTLTRALTPQNQPASEQVCALLLQIAKE
jgi:hypothetical protein